MSAHRWTIHDVPCAAGCGADDITCEHCGLCQDCARPSAASAVFIGAPQVTLAPGEHGALVVTFEQHTRLGRVSVSAVDPVAELAPVDVLAALELQIQLGMQVLTVGRELSCDLVPHPFQAGTWEANPFKPIVAPPGYELRVRVLNNGTGPALVAFVLQGWAS